MSKSSLYILGGAVLLACGYVGGKLRVLTKQIDASVEDLSKKTSIEISQKLMDSAVKKAIEDRADTAAREVSEHLTSSMNAKISSTVQDAVARIKKDAIDSVSLRMNSALNDISDADLRREVIEQGKALVAKRFEKDLADISADYRNALRRNLGSAQLGGYTIKIL